MYNPPLQSIVEHKASPKMVWCSLVRTLGAGGGVLVCGDTYLNGE